MVTEIFDNVDRTVATRDRTERIVRPALSIAAASTEGWLYRNLLDGADQLSGFMQRMVFYVVRKVEESELDLTTRGGEELEGELAAFDELWFSRWRAIQGCHRLDLHPDAVRWRDAEYEQEYRVYFRQRNDTLLSYFTRVFDGYFYKFCAIIHLSKIPGDDLDRARRQNSWDGLFSSCPVSPETAAQAWYLCRFYMENTLPLLDIMDERDKLSGERKVVDILINKFNGKARHSELLNASRMKKREFAETIETLLDREALTIGTYGKGSHVGRLYTLSPDIVENWKE